ncbi:MAG: Uma2 family endonuclease [Gemmataceae bacterium]|nr:Uma2 family endonuclease [Gemmataceae bacterium]
MEAVNTLLTAEQFRLLPDDGQPRELVRGRVVPMNVPAPRHGYLCGNVIGILREFVIQHDLGRVIGNDSGVLTERDPDTVRGADVAYYSYLRLPKGPMPEGYLPVVPELVFEVRSPTDRWKKVLAKVAEYLNGGVAVVCVLDAQTETARVFFEDQPPQNFQADQELTLPDLLPGLQVRVRRFFE